MTSYKVKTKNITEPITFTLSNSPYSLNFRAKTAYIINNAKEHTFGHIVLLLNTKDVPLNGRKKIIYDIDKKFFDNASAGDVIQVMPDGTMNILWEKKLNPHDVTLFITNQCNANCIMCPQPPGKDEFSLLESNLSILRYTKHEPIEKIGITGGEPTVKRKDLVTLLQESYRLFPSTQVDLLTNAKRLADFYYAKELALSNPNITFCISFPSDNMEDFNDIIQADIYSDIMQAIQNLAKLRQNIELRIVILRQNYARLENIAEFVYRNFPFVVHITFMGMEVVGHAFDNIDKIDIPPHEYGTSLMNAVRFLNQREMNVSVYNIPYCIVNRKVWRFLRNSISPWKQFYKDECNLCTKKSSCPGLFMTTQINNYQLEPILD
jgi:His-Xaa-Ser system radical SAM maturase HxsC